jgi:hypothetical protein
MAQGALPYLSTTGTSLSRAKVVSGFLAPIFLTVIMHAYLLNREIRGYHVWRQAQTQTVVYNFSNGCNNILHPERFDVSSGTSLLLYEFPLYQWLIAQVNRALGYKVAHTRVLGIVFLSFFLLAFYSLLRIFIDAREALLANACACFSPVLYYYCINPLPDILALFFGTLSLYFFFTFLKNNKLYLFLLFAVSVCMATLVKLPYILFGAPYLYYLINVRGKGQRKELMLQSAIFLLILIPAAWWYVKAASTWGGNMVGYGISSNKKSWFELLDYFQSNLISTMPELIANYGACPFLFYGFYLFFRRKMWLIKSYRYFIVAFLFCGLYFFYEINMIEKTHDYYLIPFIPFIFTVIALGIRNLLNTGKRILVLCLVCSTPLLAYLRIDHRWNEHPGFDDKFSSMAQEIKTIIPPDDTCVVDWDESKYIALYYLKRKGFTLDAGELNPAKLRELNSRGARYLVTKGPLLDSNQYRGVGLKLVLDKELKLYKMKN